VCCSSCSHEVLNLFTSGSEFCGSHHVLLNGFVNCSSSSQCVLLIMFPSGSQCMLLIMFPSGSQFVHIKFRILWFPPCSSEWVCNLFLKFSMCVPRHVPIRFSMCVAHHVPIRFVTCFLKFSMCTHIKFSIMWFHHVLY